MGALAGKEERQGERELRPRVAELERAVGRKTYELEIAGKALAGRVAGLHESWFGKLKRTGRVAERVRETLDDARRRIGGYVDRYHHRPDSGLDYRTPDEVRPTWEDRQRLQKTAA